MPLPTFMLRIFCIFSLLVVAPAASSLIVAGQGAGTPTSEEYDCIGADCIVGSLQAPVQVALDPNAPPWLKQFSGLSGQTIIMIHEYIEVAGGNSFTDWHEELVDPTPPGWGWSSTAPGTGVYELGTTNLVPGYSDSIGTTVIEFFFDPLPPGTGFEIWKTLEWMGPGTPPPGSIAIKQYPTPLPASLWLLGSALAALGMSRRQRATGY